MNLWRLEVARLVRTKRLLALLALYGTFGVLGPIGARYLGEIVDRLGGGVRIEVPPPTPVDGIVQFSSNAGQLGLLGVVVVAAAALSVDASPQLAAFLRTRVRHGWLLVVPRYVATLAAAASALVLGTTLAWALTAVLIGAPPVGPLVLGTLLGVLYLAVAVAVVAAVAAVASSQSATVLVSLVVLLLLPVLSALDPVRPWLPSGLLGAAGELVAGSPADEHIRSAIVALAVVPLLLTAAVRRTARREL